ncbi:3063_t:CDS:2 [Rhizophagus irregularis]|nr:3063_t:CDS:2 [Rhizophagus irregularis]
MEVLYNTLAIKYEGLEKLNKCKHKTAQQEIDLKLDLILSKISTPVQFF